MKDNFNESAFANTVKGSWEDMYDAADEAVGELEPREWETYGGHKIDSWWRFSMWDYEDDDVEKLVFPNFKYPVPVYEGTVTVTIDDWDKKTTKMTNPTLADICKFFANNHDGHHGYLEGIKYSETDGIILISGS